MIANVKNLAIACVLVAAAGGCDNSTPNSDPPKAAAPRPAPPPHVVEKEGSPSSPSRMRTATIAAVKFSGDHLVECVQASVATTIEGAVPPDVLALLLLDDFSAEESMFATGGKDALTKLLLWIATGDAFPREAFSGKKPLTEEDQNKVRQALLDQVKWPPPTFVDKVKDGDIAKADDCAVPGHIALGICHFEDRTTKVGWSFDRVHFDVRKTHDSDAGMKACLKLGGRWTAPERDDPDAAMERLRQHAGQLRNLIEAPARP